MDRYMNEINSIVEEIKANYILERQMIPLGFKSLCHRDGRNLLSLCDNFYYFSKSVKALYEKIDTDCEMMETYEGELDRYNSNLKELIQKKICVLLETAYGI